MPCFRKDPTALTLAQLWKTLPPYLFIAYLPLHLCQTLLGFPVDYYVFNDGPHHLNLGPYSPADDPLFLGKPKEIMDLGFVYLCQLVDMRHYQQRVPRAKARPVGRVDAIVFAHRAGEAYGVMSRSAAGPAIGWPCSFGTYFADGPTLNTYRATGARTSDPPRDMVRVPPDWTVQAMWLKHQEEVARRSADRGGIFRELGLEHWTEAYRKRRVELTEYRVAQGLYVPAKLP